MVKLYVLFCLFACLSLNSGVEGGIGVNYGFLGDNLPPPAQVVALLQSRNISKIRIFEPNQDVLFALHNSGIAVILGTHNDDLQLLASDPNYANNWVATNVVPHVFAVKFTLISAGNEVIPGPLANFVLGAMQNLDLALKSKGLSIPVSTAVALQTLGASFPPSAGAFADISIMQPIAGFLASTQSPLLVNIYPYFAYAGDHVNIQLDYALLQASANGVSDGQFQYQNMLQAMIDAVYAALEKVGQGNVDVVVSETGWPSAGSADATIANAQTYVNNLVAYVTSGQGTPRRPGKILEAYIFALFNENQKPAGVEQNWGLYYPDQTEVYHVTF